jgi:hypothetical protein
MKFLIALLAIVVLARAVAPTCNFNSTCIKTAQDCSGAGDFCSDGNVCLNGNTCTAQPVLGASCSGSVSSCFNGDYSGIECTSGTCMWSNIYLAGDSCNPTDTNFDNGGCLEGLTCSSSTSKCSTSTTCGSSGSGSSNAFECAAGTFCNGTTGNCDTRKAAGASCSTPLGLECDYTSICTNRGSGAHSCQAPFAQAAGAGCETLYDCKGGLYCKNQVCTAVPTSGQDCSADDSICGTDQSCVCDSKTKGTFTSATGTAHCVFDQLFLTTGEVSALINMQSCLKAKGCHDFTEYKTFDVPSGPSQCIASCLQGGFETGYEKRGDKFDRCPSGSSSAALFPALALMLAVLAMLFM